MVSPDVVQKRIRLLEGYLKKLRAIRQRTNLDAFLADSLEALARLFQQFLDADREK